MQDQSPHNIPSRTSCLQHSHKVEPRLIHVFTRNEAHANGTKIFTRMWEALCMCLMVNVVCICGLIHVYLLLLLSLSIYYRKMDEFEINSDIFWGNTLISCKFDATSLYCRYIIKMTNYLLWKTIICCLDNACFTPVYMIKKYFFFFLIYVLFIVFVIHAL